MNDGNRIVTNSSESKSADAEAFELKKHHSVIHHIADEINNRLQSNAVDVEANWRKVTSRTIKTIALFAVLSCFVALNANALTIDEILPPSSTYVPPVDPTEGQELIFLEEDPAYDESSGANGESTFSLAAAATVTNAHGQTCTPPSSAVEFVQLARALKWNPDLIYEYVYDNIKTIPSPWSLKGPKSALIERMGSPADQAELMGELLKQSCYSNITYFYPTTTSLNRLHFTNADMKNWLGGDNAANTNLLASAGFVTQYNSNGTWDIGWTWIAVNINGTVYHFNPSAKRYARKEGLATNPATGGVDVSAALGYSKSTFLSRATSGASIVTSGATPYVQGINRTNIRSDLTTFSNNLVSYIKGNVPDSATEGVIGGQGEIVALPTYSPPSGPTRWGVTALPNLSETPAGLSNYIPDGMKCKLIIRPTILSSLTLSTASLSWRRMTISYNASNDMYLNIEGYAPYLLRTAVPFGSTQNLNLTAVVPTSTTDMTVKFVAVPNSVFVILNTWGPMSRAAPERILGQVRKLDASASLEEKLGRSLLAIGYNWVAQFTSMQNIIDQVSGVISTNSYVIGIVGMHQLDVTTASPYLDLPNIRIGVYPKVAAANNLQATAGDIYATTVMSSVLESGVLEQIQSTEDDKMVAASTSKIIDQVMQSGTSKVYYVPDSATWTAVQSHLTGYSSADLTSIASRITSGSKIWLPDNGSVAIEDWSGVGYFAVKSTGTDLSVGALITGGLNGGFGGKPLTFDQVNFRLADEIPLGLYDYSCSGVSGSCVNVSLKLAADPVDMVTGHYQYDHADMTVGSGDYPYGLGFNRFYDSGSQYDIGTLGRGWTDNFALKARNDSDGFEGLGVSSPINGASAIAAMYVLQNIMDGNITPATDRLVMSAIVSRWLMDQLTGNVVSIEQPRAAQNFTKLADGSYNPPNGSADQITVTGGAVTYTAKDKTTISFNTSGRPVTWQSPSGASVSFTYSGDQLASVANNMGRSLAFTYGGTCASTSTSLLTQVADNAGRHVSYAYDTDCNLTTYSDTLNHDTEYVYGEPGALEQIFYPSQPNNPFVTNTYDSLGRITNQLDVNGYETVLYLAGTRAEFINPDGGAQIYYFNQRGKELYDINALGQTKSYVYDGLDRVKQVIMPEGNAVTYTYDAKSNVLTQTLTPKPGSSLTPLVTAQTYDPLWNKPLLVSDAAGHVTAYTYDSVKGNLLSVTQPSVGGQSPVTQYAYNARGQVTSMTDPLGKVTTSTYSGSTEVLLSMTEDAGASGLQLQTQFGYDAVGNITSVTDPRGFVTTQTYDAERRVTRTSAPSSIGYATNYTYDADGNQLTVTRATGNVQTATYSPSFKPLTVTDPSGNVTTYVYDVRDHVSRVTDAQGRVTDFAYDTLGRQTSEKNTAIQATPLKQLAYTANGNLLTLTDAKGKITTYAYDGFDRLKTVTYPNATNENYTYDAVGNVLAKQQRSGTTITMTYDALNRLKTKTPQGLPTVNYSYDLASRPVSITKTGAGSVSYAYDSAGRAITASQIIGSSAVSRSVTYQYDAANNNTRVTWPDGYYATYIYDGLNRITSVKEGSSGATLATYNYSATLPRRTGVAYGNGVNTSYSYAANDDLLTVGQNFVGSAVTYTYGYNKVHQRTSLTLSDTSYLKRPSQTVSLNYTANSVNQYTNVAGVTYTYDNNGNLTNDGTNSYAYDVENRLTSVNAPNLGNVVSFTYDALNRRISKTSTGSLNTGTSYLLDGDREIAEYDATGQTLQRRYVYGPGIDEPVLRVDVSGATSTANYNHQDGLGSVIAVSDSTGHVTSKYGYGPYGESSSLSGNPYRFTGRRLDPETGLYYYRSRYYSAALGRFMQNDTIGYEGGINLYAYVGNDPVNFVDASGLARVMAGVEGTLVLGVGGSVEAGLYYDTDTQTAGIYGSLSGSVGLEAGAGGTVAFQKDEPQGVHVNFDGSASYGVVSQNFDIAECHTGSGCHRDFSTSSSGSFFEAEISGGPKFGLGGSSSLTVSYSHEITFLTDVSRATISTFDSLYYGSDGDFISHYTSLDGGRS